MKKLLTYFVIGACVACNTLGGHRGISDNIEESKKIGVYLKEFTVISGNTQLKGIKDVWAEYAWNHPYTFKKPRIRKESQTLIFEFDNLQELGEYDKTWALRENVVEYENYNCGYSLPYRLIFCEVDNYLKDTLHLNIVRGDLVNNKITSKQEIVLVAQQSAGLNLQSSPKE